MGGGGWWKINGRRRGGCGPGMPGPYGGWKGERVLAGRCAGVGWFRAISVGGRRPRRPAEGSRPLPTVWGETGWQSSNGRRRKARGPGMPGPYGGRSGKRVLAGR